MNDAQHIYFCKSLKLFSEEKRCYAYIINNNYNLRLRNEYEFWKVLGIMNTSGLTLQETRSINDSMNLSKIECISYIYILL